MTMPEPPASPDFFSESAPPAPKKMGALLAPLVLACIIIGFTVGWVVAPGGTADPLAALHARAVAGCTPIQFSLTTDAPVATASRSAAGQIEGARRAGFTNAAYLVTEVAGRTVVTLYAEDCRGA